MRFPAPVIVALSSPNVVSDALHLVRYVPHLVRGRGTIAEEGGDHGAGLGDLFLPVAAGQDRVVLGRADGQPVILLPRRGVQPGEARSVGQPAAAWPVIEGEADALLHAGDDVPACVQDRGDQLMAGKIPVEADDAAGEQAPGGGARAA